MSHRYDSEVPTKTTGGFNCTDLDLQSKSFQIPSGRGHLVQVIGCLRLFKRFKVHVYMELRSIWEVNKFWKNLL